jgi:hypothetical protein
MRAVHYASSNADDEVVHMATVVVVDPGCVVLGMIKLEVASGFRAMSESGPALEHLSLDVWAPIAMLITGQWPRMVQHMASDNACIHPSRMPRTNAHPAQ